MVDKCYGAVQGGEVWLPCRMDVSSLNLATLQGVVTFRC